MPTRKRRKRAKTVGLPPGSLIHTGERKTESTTVRVLDYSVEGLREVTVTQIADLVPLIQGDTVTWVRVVGLHEVSLIQQVGEALGVHPLILEDILDTEQRPKLEDMGDHLFIVAKQLSWDAQTRELDPDQVSLILGARYLVSFEEKPSELFESIEERIRAGKGRVRGLGPDYLAYRLLDAIVDGYFLILEGMEDQLEAAEEKVVREATPEVLSSLHDLKRDLVQFRKLLWPLREVVGALERRASPLISDSTAIYLRDLYDHLIQVMDTLETFREVVSGMLDIYLSSVSNRLNEVMKVLTIIATLFMPLSFLASVYGMNFEYLPELRWKWAYPAWWGLILTISTFMLLYFRRRRWL